MMRNVGGRIVGGEPHILWPGMWHIGSNRATVQTLVFVTSASSTSSSITIPSTAQEGDLAVLFDSCNNGGSGPPSDVIPTDWTGLVTATQDTISNDTRTRVSYKKLKHGDPGSSVTGISTGVEDNKLMLIFRPDVPAEFTDPTSWTAENTANNPASQSVTCSSETSPIVVLGMAAILPGTAAFSTTTPNFDRTVATADADILVGFKIYNASPQNHTIDMGDLGNANSLATGYIKAS